MCICQLNKPPSAMIHVSQFDRKSWTPLHPLLHWVSNCHVLVSSMGHPSFGTQKRVALTCKESLLLCYFSLLIRFDGACQKRLREWGQKTFVWPLFWFWSKEQLTVKKLWGLLRGWWRRYSGEPSLPNWRSVCLTYRQADGDYSVSITDMLLWWPTGVRAVKGLAIRPSAWLRAGNEMASFLCPSPLVKPGRKGQ